MRSTTAVTGYGRIGTDGFRITIIPLNDGTERFACRKADGSNAILGKLPLQWRTSGDMVSSMALTGGTFNLSQMLWADVPEHVHARRSGKGRKAFKATRTLRQMVLHMTKDAAETTRIVNGLKAFYAEQENIEAVAA